MAGQSIIIYKRDAGSGVAKRFCVAELLDATSGSVVFLSNEFLVPALGVTFLLMSKSPHGESPAQFRELMIPPMYNPGNKPPYSYALPIGEKWTGEVGKEKLPMPDPNGQINAPVSEASDGAKDASS